LPESSLFTVALNNRDCEVATLTEDGEIETEMPRGTLVVLPPPHPTKLMDKMHSMVAAASVRIAPLLIKL
jgi:hypothetical protein